MKAVEGSLKRLDTDHIDLYIMHEPDPGTPIEETLRALDIRTSVDTTSYSAMQTSTNWTNSKPLRKSAAITSASLP